MTKTITKPEIEAARLELKQAMTHLTEAERILKPYAGDTAVYQVMCLIPITGTKRAIGWLREIPVQKEGNDG
jgi:hypothetical protein